MASKGNLCGEIHCAPRGFRSVGDHHDMIAHIDPAKHFGHSIALILGQQRPDHSVVWNNYSAQWIVYNTAFYRALDDKIIDLNSDIRWDLQCEFRHLHLLDGTVSVVEWAPVFTLKDMNTWLLLKLAL